MSPISAVDEIAGVGGTYLGSSRSRRFYESAFRVEAGGRLPDRGVEGLIVIGGKHRVLIIKAEGVPMPATRLARDVQDRLTDHPDIHIRATVLGYLVRGGRPSFRDRMMSGRSALAAVNALDDGLDDVMVAWNATTPDSIPTEDARVSYCPLDTVLAESRALEDGSSEVTARRVLRMQEIQGVLSL